MTMPKFDRRSLILVAELAVAISIWMFASRGVEALAAAMGFTLPELPLLRHVYIVFTGELLICLWMYLRRESFADIGLIVPRRWLLYIGQGVLILVASLLYDVVGRPIVDPMIAQLTHSSPTLAEQHFASLKGNLSLFLFLVPFAWICGGFGEEMLNRGFIMTRFAQLLGGGRWAWIAAMVLQAIPFALAHTYQGPVGMAGVFVAGVIFGTGRLLCRGNLWPLMIAHGLLDTLGFFLMYTGVVHA